MDMQLKNGRIESKDDGMPLFSDVHKCFDPWWKRWAKRVWYFFFGFKINEDNLEAADTFIGVDLSEGDSYNAATIVRRDKKTGVMYLEEVQGLQDTYYEQIKSMLRKSHKPIYVTRTPYPSPWYGKSMTDMLKEERERDREFEVRVNGKFDPEVPETDNYGFMECDECRKKAGSPQLCVSCLHNRNLIHTLRAKLNDQ